MKYCLEPNSTPLKLCSETLGFRISLLPFKGRQAPSYPVP
jgi:hypothetical protein